MSQVHYDTLLNIYRKRIEEENKGNKVTVRQETPVTSQSEQKSATSIIPVVRKQETKNQALGIPVLSQQTPQKGMHGITDFKRVDNTNSVSGSNNQKNVSQASHGGGGTRHSIRKTEKTDDEIIKEYESYPEYNIFLRNMSPIHEDQYRRKQNLYGQYRQAKNRKIGDFMSKNGITEDTLKSAFGEYGSKPYRYSDEPTNLVTMTRQKASDDMDKAYSNIKKAAANAGINFQDIKEYYENMEAASLSNMWKDVAASHGVLGTAASVPISVFGGASKFTNETVNYATGKPIGSDEALNAYSGTAGNMRGAVKENISDAIENPLLDKAANVLYDAGTSVGDMALGGIGGKTMALGLGALNAGAGTFNTVQEKDLTPNQMMGSAAAAAAIEVATEKLPLDNLWKMANSAAPRTAKRVIANILSQAGAEGTEEIVSEVANALVDGAINKDKSEIMLNIQNYMSQGMTEKQATAQAYKDIALSALNAGVTGAVSGEMMAGAGTLYNKVKYPSSQSTVSQEQANNDYIQKAENVDAGQNYTDNNLPLQTTNVNTETDAYKQSRKQSIISQINDVFTGKMGKDDQIQIGKTPEILKKYGAPDLDLKMSQDTMFKIAYPEGYSGGKHNLGFDVVAELPYQLSDPVAIIKSVTQPNSFVVLTEYVDEHGYPIITAIHMDKMGKIEPANQIASMYGKREMGEWAKGQREAGNILYEKQNKGIESIAPAGLQLPSLYSESDPFSNNSVPTSGEKVNTSAENITENNGNIGENTAASKVKIDNFADLNRDLDKLVGMYKGNENTQNLYNQMKTALNEYMQTYNQEAIDRALNLAAQIDESLIGHSYTRKGSGKNSAKAQNNRMTTTYADGDFLDAVLSYAGDIRNAARNNVLSVANNGRNTGNGDAGNGNFIRYADSTAESGNKISQTRENTIENSGLASDEELLQYHAPEKFTYEEISESESMERATEKLNKYGQSYVNELLSAQNQNLSGTDIDALMMEYKRVSEQARKTGSDADWNRAQDIMKKIQVSSTRNAQALQALAKWSRNTPEGQLAQANTLIEQTIEKKYGKRRVKKAQETVDTVYEAAKTGDTAKMQSALENLKIDPNSIQQEILDTSGTKDANRNTVIDLLKKKGVLNKNLAEALKEDTVTQRKVIDMLSQLEDMDIDSYEAQVLMARAGKILASNMKHTFGEKVQQILYNNMLGNFRTLVSRNAGGNVPVALLEQVRQLISAPLDKLVSLKTGQRTTTGMSLGKLKAYADGFAKGFSAEVKDVNNTINAYLKEQSSTGLHTSKSGENTLLNAIKNNSSAFKGNNIATKLLNFTNDMVKHGLSVGDRPFFEATKNQAKYEINQLVKKGCNVDTQELNLDDYIEQASTLIALEAVYQGDTELSKGFQKIRNGLAEMTKGMIGTDIMSTAVVPFVKTPSNVLDMAVEYSPFGALKNLIGTATEVKSGDFNQRRFVDETSRNIVGTFLMAAVVTAFKDAFTGGYDDDKDVKAAQKASGMQEYALKLDGGAKNYDMGWIPVFGSTIESGAAFKDARDNGSSILGATGAAMAQTAQSVFDQSMLESLSNMLGSNSYNQDSGFAKQALNSIAGSYIGQLAPSLPRQIAQSTDKYERNLGSYGTSEYYRNSFINSIPGLRETLPVKYNNEGKPVLQNQGRGLGSKLIENMLSPGKLTDVNYSDLSSEAISLFDKTGEKKQFVPTANKNDIKSGDTAPTTEQFNEYKRVFGENNAIGGEALLDSDFYKKLSADDKVKYLSQMYSDMKQVAKKEVLKDYTYPQDYEKKMDMYETFGMDGLINYYDIQNTRESTGVNDTFSAIDKLDLTDREKGEYIEKLIDMSNAATAINKTYGNSGLYQWYSMRSKADADGNGNISNKEMVNQIVQSNMDYADMVNYASVLYDDSKKKTAREKAVEAISEAYPNLLYYKWMERLTKLKGGKTDEQREAEKVSKIYEKMSNIQGGHASTSGHTYDEYLERFTKLYNQRKDNSGAAASTRKHTYEEYLERFTKLYNERYGISNQPAQKHTYEEYYDRISKLYAEWQRKRYQ